MFPTSYQRNLEICRSQTTRWKENRKKADAKKDTPKTDEPKAEAKDETDDLFGDDDEDETAKLEAMKIKKEAEKLTKEKEKKAEKPGVIAKSLIVVDVKVWEVEQDLDALAAKVLAITRDGLVWKTEYKLNDVAFGVKKITIGCVVEDEKVSIDDIIEEVESWEDDVQSVDIVSFNKL